MAVGANAVVLDSRQDCVRPSSNLFSLPSECRGPALRIGTALANINGTDFSGVELDVDEFCMPQCVQPFVDYYTCLGETDYANVLDGFLCGKYNNQSCFELWRNTFNVNGSNPDGVSFAAVTLNCRDPLVCNSNCSTQLNRAKDILGCCLAGVVEFNSCNALAKVRFEECSIRIPAICDGVTDVPTTPAPEYPTSGTGCVHPLDDPEYSSSCKSTLTAVENVAISESESGFTVVDPSTNVTAVLDGFCIPECVRPLVAYYNCTGEPDYANAINGFFCGKEDNQYCLEKLPTIFQRPGGAGGPVSALTLSSECNDVLECNDECLTELTEAKEAAGCCLAGAVEFTVCGPLEQVRFDECDVDVGSVCPGIDLSGGEAVIVPCGLTLLSIITAFISFLV